MKKLIKKFLKKKLFERSKKRMNYYFLRWLVSLVEDKKVKKDICFSVGFWVARTDFRNPYTLLDLFVIDDTVYLYLTRPGLWIGKGGTTIENLKQSICDDMKLDYKISILEARRDEASMILMSAAASYFDY